MHTTAGPPGAVTLSNETVRVLAPPASAPNGGLCLGVTGTFHVSNGTLPAYDEICGFGVGRDLISLSVNAFRQPPPAAFVQQLASLLITRAVANPA